MATSERKTVLVLGANYRQVFGIMSSLHDAGYRVMLGRGGEPGIAEKSYFIDEIWPHPPIADGNEDLIDGLHRLAASRDDLGYIFPADDREAALLARNAAVLPKGVTVVGPDPATILTCQDKAAASALAADLDVPLAPYRVVKNPVELAEAGKAIGTPCVVKPSRSMSRVHGRKAFICQDLTDIDSYFMSWPKGHRSLIVQKYIHGYRSNITFAARNGDILCAQQKDSIRTHRMDETGLHCLAVTVALAPVLMTHTERLARYLNYTGVGMIQFMVAKKGNDLSFLELNPRIGGTSTRPYFPAMDFPRMAIALATRQPLAPGNGGFDYPVGRSVSSIHIDLSGMITAFRHREIGVLDAALWSGKALATFIRADADAVWSWRDPMPALYALTLPFRRRRAASR